MSQRHPLLIANADDLARDADATEGILLAARAGLVRGTSVMVNQPGAAEAVHRASSAGLDLGIHLNVTEGRPVLPSSRVGRLVREDGRFAFDADDPPSSLLQLTQLLSTSSDAREQVRAEFRAQVAAFAATGVRLTHVNVHHFLPLIAPSALDAALELAEEARVPLRGRVSPMETIFGLDEDTVLALSRRLRGASVPIPDVALSGAYDRPPGSSEVCGTALLVALRRLAGCVEVVELVLHPSLPADRSRSPDPWHEVRAAEFGVAGSATFARAVQDLGYRIGTWSELIAP